MLSVTVVEHMYLHSERWYIISVMDQKKLVHAFEIIGYSTNQDELQSLTITKLGGVCWRSGRATYFGARGARHTSVV